MGAFRLELINRHNIADPGIGLNEPSGLTLNADGTALYTVSDDTRAIFCMDLEGRVLTSESFFVSVLDLEGLALSADGLRLFAVQEDANAVISVDLASRRELQHRPLAEMSNYASVEMHFPAEPDNKGLEGITVNTRNGHVFVVKECRPGLLIELDAECRTILSSRLLTQANGFSHPRVGPRRLDFSGLSYDCQRDTLWIASDQGQCLFHYDLKGDLVLQRLDLLLKPEGKSKRVRKAEGIAVDSERGRVYVVSDRDAELYVFQLHG
ncbi:SdiA-regulated [Synechococcus sp. MIT S9509]|uniref:SdiA-regulated domain-containing protein n=1 Tax=Synechococcus sp. MIT S9509 TaxID=1801630 RepID=UPI0007BC7597|nr:SdiA-regulated domain-containing protein [Synechococcus sp. MIT S9509]KZR91896.1 SdiA-regulated [Synechococcus sp. MIT S9509]